jgi:1,4-alpha-glucan branching enzyme
MHHVVYESVYRNDPRAQFLVRDRHSNLNSVIYDHRSFEWTDQHFAVPPPAQCVLYEMHVGSFTKPHGGSLIDAIGRLDYLRELGVSVISLMPVTLDVHPHPGANSSPSPSPSLARLRILPCDFMLHFNRPAWIHA